MNQNQPNQPETKPVTTQPQVGQEPVVKTETTTPPIQPKVEPVKQVQTTTPRQSRQNRSSKEKTKQAVETDGGRPKPSFGTMPEEQGLTENSKISVRRFVNMAATTDNVDAMFHKYLDRLENPRATVIEMRRLGHIIDYK